ncbi:MAG: hypothetical protein Q8P62_02105 [Candidatus Peregrinibacteria bacterium]|nr:hypothetical protein [Candidatus Peregrinibacteria bacterium]
MLNPELTYQKGVEAIGETKGTKEWILDADSWAIIKEQRLQVRDWLSGTLEGNIGIDIDEALYGPLEELIYNAGEHGSEFGKKGVVKIKVTVGNNGSLWTIEQPTQGPDLVAISDKHASGQDLHYDGAEDGKARERGIGFTETAEDPDLQVWSDQVAGKANRVICLRLNK